MLARRKAHRHQTSKQELDELRAVVKRDLADAALPALSDDRRDSLLRTMRPCRPLAWPVACAGYRVAAVAGHHALSFECAGLALGKPADKFVLFFDSCRRRCTIRSSRTYRLQVCDGTAFPQYLLHFHNKKCARAGEFSEGREYLADQRKRNLPVGESRQGYQENRQRDSRGIQETGCSQMDRESSYNECNDGRV